MHANAMTTHSALTAARFVQNPTAMKMITLSSAAVTERVHSMEPRSVFATLVTTARIAANRVLA